MVDVDEFAHGYRYGDYSGVVFYGPPTDGFWLDRLAVSNCYMRPLFHSVLDRAWRDGRPVPQLAAEWNAVAGWRNGGVCEVPTVDAAEFASALAQVASADVAEHCAGCTVEECLHCAAIVREFVGSRLARGVSLFIEDD